jgi:hypothetical protein
MICSEASQSSLAFSLILLYKWAIPDNEDTPYGGRSLPFIPSIPN